MRRREFIAGLALAAAMERAQAHPTGKVYHLVIAHPIAPIAEINKGSSVPVIRGFFGELSRLGYVEGQNILIDRYSGLGQPEHYPELARGAVQLNPDLILAVGTVLVREFKAATATIPIVGIMGDPVASKMVFSLARPRGNITGFSTDAGAEIWASAWHS